MTEQEYKEFVNYIKNDDLSQVDNDTLHGIIGIVTEAGELADILKKALVYNKPIDVEHLKEETGDLLHYMIYLCNRYHWSLEDLMIANTEKLKKRYPNGYSNEAALKQADKKENKDV